MSRIRVRAFFQECPFWTLVLLLPWLAACSEPAPPTPAVAPPAADLVVVGADVRTVDPALPSATAFALRDGRFVAIGGDAQIRTLVGPDTQLIDLGGATVLPGFVDGHTHLASGGDLISGVDLFNVPDKATWLARVADAVDRLAPGQWVLGGRWDYTIAEGIYPTRQDLDTVAPDNPVALSDIDGHSLWVNSAALERAGIDADTPVPDGGEIVLDPVTGLPTGILKEGAGRLIGREASYQEAVAATYEVLDQTLAYASSLGITSVHDMSGPETLERYRRLADEGALNMRVWFGMFGVTELGRAAELAETRADFDRRDPQRGPLLAFGYLKHMIDGVLSTHTAVMFEPYSDRPEERGDPFYPQEALDGFVGAGNAAGFPVAIHAIGDGAVRMALDAFEAAGRPELANRIEHIEIVTPEDVPRFVGLHVAPSMQPNHATGVIGKYITERVGAERERSAYVWGDFLRAGAPLALSSDWPTSPLAPLAQLADAVLRESPYGLYDGSWYPEQALNFEQALRAYTQSNADLSAWGDEIGSISVGKWADFVVLDGTLPAEPKRELLERKVAQTWLAGDRVYP